MDKFDITETRTMLSVYTSQLEDYGIRLVDLDDANIDQIIGEIKTGKLLLKGQIVMLQSTPPSVLPPTPVVVTGITNYSNVTYEYTVKVLGGELNGGLITGKINTITDGVVEPIVGVLAIKDAIMVTKLGYADLRALKVAMGVNKFYILNADFSITSLT